MMNLSLILFLVLLTLHATLNNAQVYHWATVSSTNAYVESWNDQDSGADHDVDCYNTNAPVGYYELSTFCQGPSVPWGYYNLPPSTMYVTTVLDNGDGTVKPPTSWTELWTDSDSGANLDGSIWRATCPTGFVALGHYMMAGHSTVPSLNAIRCINVNMTKPSTVGKLIWNTSGTDASTMQIFQIGSTNYFISQENGNAGTLTSEYREMLTAIECPGDSYDQFNNKITCSGYGQCDFLSGTCLCNAGFQTSSTLGCVDLNECVVGGYCTNGERCLNEIGSYSCFTVNVTNPLCYESYTGIISVAWTKTNPYNIAKFSTEEYGYTLKGPNQDGTLKISQSTFDLLYQGNYILTVQSIVDNSTFNSSNSFTLTMPQQLSASAIVQNVLCYDYATGNITITASGGTNVYGYRLDPHSSTNAQIGNVDFFNGIIAGDHQYQVTDSNNCESVVYNFTITQPSSYPVLSASLLNPVICKGTNSSNILVQAQNGTPPYYFFLDSKKYTTPTIFSSLGNPTISNGVYSAILQNLPAHDYIVTLVDSNGCFSPDTVNNNQPQITILSPEASIALSVDYEVYNISCHAKNDGQITLFPSGGKLFPGNTPHYEYSIHSQSDNGSPVWENTTSSWTGLSSGIYIVYIKDYYGCEITQTFSIVDPDVLTATLNVTGVKCLSDQNGQIEVFATGGTTPYEYTLTGMSLNIGPQFSNLFDSLPTGNYTIQVTDKNSCFFEISTFVGSPNSLPSANISVSPAKCKFSTDGVIAVIAQGGTPPYHYKLDDGSFDSLGGWVNNAIYKGSGDYYVQIQDNNGCVVSGSPFLAHIDQPSTLLDTEVTIITTPTCYGDNDGVFNVITQGGGNDYQYVLLDGVHDSYTFNTQFTNIAGGIFNLVTKDSNGCIIIQNMTMMQPAPFVININTVPAKCSDSAGEIDIDLTGGTAPYYVKIVNESDYSTSLHYPNEYTGTHQLFIHDSNSCPVGVFNVTVTSPPALSIGFSENVPPDCYGSTGFFEFYGIGGVGDYSFQFNDSGAWGPGTYYPSVLAQDYYHIEVLDGNGCFYETYLPFQSPPALHGSLTLVDPVTCDQYSDAVVRLEAWGGTPPYKYVMYSQLQGSFGNVIDPVSSIDIPNVEEGTLDGVILLDSYYCNIFLPPLNVTGPPSPLTVYGNVEPVGCDDSNGTIEVIAEGGWGGYQYVVCLGESCDLNQVVDSNIFSVEVGFYAIEVIDSHGCVEQTGAQLLNPDIPTFDYNIIPATCSGNFSDGVIEITDVWTENGDTDFLYRIGDDVFTNSSSFYNLTIGDYLVEVLVVNGCSATQTITVTGPSPLNASLIPYPEFWPLNSAGYRESRPGLNDGWIAVSVAGDSGVYLFFLEGVSLDTNNSDWLEWNTWNIGQGWFNFTNLTPGSYNIYIRDSDDNACKTSILNVVVFSPSIPSTPQNPLLTLSISDGFIQVSWNIPFDGGLPITNFLVQLGEALDTVSLPMWRDILPNQQAISVETTSITIPFVLGHVYYVRVAAQNALGVSAFSDSFEGGDFLVAAPTPNPPSISFVTQNYDSTSTTLDGASVKLFLAPSGLISPGSQFTYTVQFSSQTNSTWGVIVSQSPSLSWIMTGLHVNTTYYFQARTFSNVSSLDISAWSDVFSYTAIGVPSSPYNLQITNIDPTQQSFSLSWNKPTQSSGSNNLAYLVQISFDQTKWITASQTNFKNTSITIVASQIGIKYGLSYFARVFAKTEAGLGPSSDISSFVFGVVPKAPTNITSSLITINSTIANVQFSWTASNFSEPLPITYTLVISNKTSQIYQVSQYTTLSITVSLPIAISYTVQVYAQNLIGYSNVSTLSWYAGDVPPIPNSPSLSPVTWSQYAAIVTVTWLPQPAYYGLTVTGYILTIVSGNSSTPITINLPSTSTSYDAVNLQSDTLTFFSLATKNSLGVSQSSLNSTIITIALPPQPLAPVILTQNSPVYTSTTVTYTITWGPSSPNLDGGSTLYYTLLQTNNNTGVTTTIDTIPSSTVGTLNIPFSFPVPHDLLMYRYHVIATNGKGDSTPSNDLVVSLMAIPAVPVILYTKLVQGLTDSTSSIHLVWKDDDLSDTFEVEISVNPNSELSNIGWILANTSPIQQPQFLVTNLTIGITYYFRVTGITSQFKKSSPSVVVSQFIGLPPQNTILDNVPIVSNFNGTSVTLVWNPTPQTPATYTGLLESYQLQISTFDSKTSATPSPFTILALLNSTTYTLDNLESGVVYYFEVVPYNIAGLGTRSVTSQAVSAIGLPPSPQNVNFGFGVESDDGKYYIDLSWTKIDSYNIDYYLVEYSFNSADWQTVTVLPSHGAYFTFNNFTLGQNLSAIVYAHNVMGTSSSSQVVSTILEVSPGAMLTPTLSNVNIGLVNSSVLISWQKVSFTGGSESITYLLEYAVPPNNPTQNPNWVVAQDSILSDFFTLIVTTGSEYLIRVTAKNELGYGQPSPSVDILFALPPLQPTDFSYSLTTSNIPLLVYLNWNAPQSLGTPIQYYVLDYQVQNSSQSSSAVTTQILIAGGQNEGDLVSTSIHFINYCNYNASIYAVNQLGQSSKVSISFSLFVPPLFEASTPSVGPLTMNGTDTSFNVLWQVDATQTGITDQILEVSDDSGLNWESISSPITIFSVAGSTELAGSVYVTLTTGKTYSLRVRIFNNAGEGPVSNSTSFVTVLPPLFHGDISFSPLILLEINNDDDDTPLSSDAQIVVNYTIYWPAISNNGGDQNFNYVVEYSIDSLYAVDRVWTTLLITETLNSYNTTGILGTTVYFRISVQNLAGASAYLSNSNILVSVPRTPNTPTFALITPNTIWLSFPVPFSGGGLIQSYTVTQRKVNQSHYEEISQQVISIGSVFPQIINNQNYHQIVYPVESGNFYSFTIATTNAGKLTGSSSQESQSVLSYYAPKLIDTYPSQNTVLGGAYVIFNLDPVIPSYRTICMFSLPQGEDGLSDNVIVNSEEYNSIITLDQITPDSLTGLINWYTICKVPLSSLDGIASVSISWDNYAWSNPVNFIYREAPQVSLVSLVSSPMYGGATLTISGFNFDATYFAQCQIGNALIAGQYIEVTDTTATITCVVPFSSSVSPPRLDYGIILDGITTSLSPQRFHYYNYNIVKISSITPTLVNDTLSLPIYLKGSFVDTGDTYWVRFINNFYGNFDSKATLINSTTLLAKTIPLPGASTTWKIAVSLNDKGDWHYTDVSSTIALQSTMQGKCSTLSCATCVDTEGCSWISYDENGQGWCRNTWNTTIFPQLFTGTVRGYCDTYGFRATILPVPFEITFHKVTHQVTIQTVVSMDLRTDNPDVIQEAWYSCYAYTSGWTVLTQPLTPFTMTPGPSFVYYHQWENTAQVLCTYTYNGTNFEWPKNYQYYPVGVEVVWNNLISYNIDKSNETHYNRIDTLVRPYAFIDLGSPQNTLTLIQTLPISPTISVNYIGDSLADQINWYLDGSLIYSSYDLTYARNLPLDTTILTEGVHILEVYLDGILRDSQDFFVKGFPHFMDPLLGGFKRSVVPEKNKKFLRNSPYDGESISDTILDAEQISQNILSDQLDQVQEGGLPTTQQQQYKGTALTLEIEIASSQLSRCDLYYAYQPIINDPMKAWQVWQALQNSSAQQDTFELEQNVFIQQQPEDQTQAEIQQNYESNQIIKQQSESGNNDITQDDTTQKRSLSNIMIDTSSLNNFDQQGQIQTSTTIDNSESGDDQSSHTIRKTRSTSKPSTKEAEPASKSEKHEESDEPSVPSLQPNIAFNLGPFSISPIMGDGFSNPLDDSSTWSPESYFENAQNIVEGIIFQWEWIKERKAGVNVPIPGPVGGEKKFAMSANGQIGIYFYNGDWFAGFGGGIFVQWNDNWQGSLLVSGQGLFSTLETISSTKLVDVITPTLLSSYPQCWTNIYINDIWTWNPANCPPVTYREGLVVVPKDPNTLQIQYDFPTSSDITVWDQFTVDLQGQIIWSTGWDLGPVTLLINIIPAVDLELTFNNKTWAIHTNQPEGIDIGNNVELLGTLRVDLGIQLVGGLGPITVTATVDGYIILSISSPPSECLQAIGIEISLEISIDLGLFSIDIGFSFGFQINFNKKRSIDEGMDFLLNQFMNNLGNGEIVAIRANKGFYRQEFQTTSKQRSDEKYGVLVDDAYPYNDLIASNISPFGNLLALWINFNTSAPLNQTTSIVYSVYNIYADSWTTPSLIDGALEGDDHPSVILLTNNNTSSSSDQFLAVWGRFYGVNEELLSQGLIQQSSVLSKSEITYSIFNTETSTWGTSQRLTNNNNYEGPVSLCNFQDLNGNPLVLVLWMSDNNNEFSSNSIEGDLTFTIFDPITNIWEESSILVQNITTRDYAQFGLTYNSNTKQIMLLYTQYVPTDFITQPDILPPDNFTDFVIANNTDSNTTTTNFTNLGVSRAFFMNYNVTTSSWSTRTPLYSLDTTNFYLNNSDSDSLPMTTLHNGNFILSWVNNGRPIYAIWPPTLEGFVIAPIYFGGNDSLISINKISTSNSGYTTLTWLVPNQGVSNYFYSVMEPDSFVFGAVVNLPKANDTFDRVLSISIQDSDLPFMVRLYTEQIATYQSNGTVNYGTAYIKYDTVILGPDVDLQEIDFSQYNDGDSLDQYTSVVISLDLVNGGGLSSKSNQANVEIWQGSLDSPGYYNPTSNLISSQPLIFIAPNDTLTVHQVWTPNLSFEGYVWVIVTNSNTSITYTHMFYFSLPAIDSLNITHLDTDQEGVLTITAQVLNATPYIGNLTSYPISIFLLQANHAAILLTSNLRVDGVAGLGQSPTLLSVKITESEIASSIGISVKVGRNQLLSAAVSTILPYDSSFTTYQNDGSGVNLGISQEITIINFFEGTALVSVDVVNKGLFTITNVQVGALTTEGENLVPINIVTIPSISGFSNLTTQISLFNLTVGVYDVSFVVDPFRLTGDTVLSDNTYQQTIQIYTYIDLGLQSSDIVLSNDKNTLQVAVYNFLDTAVEETVEISVYIGTTSTPQFLLLGQIQLSDIEANICTIASIENLNTTQILTTYTSQLNSPQITLVLPSYYSGQITPQVVTLSITSAQSNTLPVCGITLFETAQLAPIQDQYITIGTELDLTITLTQTTQVFYTVTFNLIAPNLLQNITLINNNDNTATLTGYSPPLDSINITSPNQLNVSQTSISLTIQLVDNDVVYSEVTFNVYGTVPAILSASPVPYFGGVSTIIGKYFGNDPSEIVVIIVSDYQNLTCSNLSLSHDASYDYITCHAPAIESGNLLGLPIEVAVSNIQNPYPNHYLNYFTLKVYQLNSDYSIVATTPITINGDEFGDDSQYIIVHLRQTDSFGNYIYPNCVVKSVTANLIVCTFLNGTQSGLINGLLEASVQRTSCTSRWINVTLIISPIISQPSPLPIISVTSYDHITIYGYNFGNDSSLLNITLQLVSGNIQRSFECNLESESFSDTSIVCLSVNGLFAGNIYANVQRSPSLSSSTFISTGLIPILKVFDVPLITKPLSCFAPFNSIGYIKCTITHLDTITNNSPLIYYLVYYKIHSTTTYSTFDVTYDPSSIQSNFTISSIEPEENYQIRIAAISGMNGSLFTSALSPSCFVLSNGAPSTPTFGIGLNFATSDSVSINWVTPQRNGLDIEFYEIYYSEVLSLGLLGNEVTLQVNGNTTQTIITGLISNTNYIVSYSATNNIGTSSRSPATTVSTLAATQQNLTNLNFTTPIFIPSPVQNLTITYMTSWWVSIQWSTNDTIPLKAYMIQFYKNNAVSGKLFSVLGNTFDFTLTFNEMMRWYLPIFSVRVWGVTNSQIGPYVEIPVYVHDQNDGFWYENWIPSSSFNFLNRRTVAPQINLNHTYQHTISLDWTLNTGVDTIVGFQVFRSNNFYRFKIIDNVLLQNYTFLKGHVIGNLQPTNKLLHALTRYEDKTTQIGHFYQYKILPFVAKKGLTTQIVDSNGLVKTVNVCNRLSYSQSATSPVYNNKALLPSPILSIPNQTVYESQQLVLELNPIFYNNQVTLSIIDLPSWITLQQNSPSKWNLFIEPDYSVVSELERVSVFTLTIQLNDDQHILNVSFNLQVTHVEQPHAISVGGKPFYEGKTSSIPIFVSDNENLEITILGLPEWIQLNKNSEGWTLTGTPNSYTVLHPNTYLTYSLQIILGNGLDYNSSTIFTNLTVFDVNQLPQININLNSPMNSIQADTSHNFTIIVSDSDNDFVEILGDIEDSFPDWAFVAQISFNQWQLTLSPSSSVLTNQKPFEQFVLPISYTDGYVENPILTTYVITVTL